MLNGLNISSDDIDVILLKANLEADAPLQIDQCDKAVYSRMSVVLKGAFQNITEGGYSISWNMEAVKLFYNALCNELELENVLLGRPKVRNRSNYW